MSLPHLSEGAWVGVGIIGLWIAIIGWGVLRAMREARRLDALEKPSRCDCDLCDGTWKEGA